MGFNVDFIPLKVEFRVFKVDFGVFKKLFFVFQGMFRPWTHTSDDSYIYQLSLVVATATVLSTRYVERKTADSIAAPRRNFEADSAAP